MRPRRDVADGTAGSVFSADSRNSEINRTSGRSASHVPHGQLPRRLRYAAVRAVPFSPAEYW